MNIKETARGPVSNVREVEGSVCRLKHDLRFTVSSLTSGDRDGELREAFRHMIEARHEVKGRIYGGYEYEPELADKLSVSFFKKLGLLKPLVVRFRGNVRKAISFAYEDRQVDTETAARIDSPDCRHHWIIESPKGALSDGRCKICGEERQFRNSASDYIWDGDREISI